MSTGIAPGDTEACLTGETLDGTLLEDCDAVETVTVTALRQIGYELTVFLAPLLWLHRRRGQPVT